MTEPFRKPKYVALIQLLRSADTLWNSSRSFFETWGISPSQFNVLNLLHGSADGLSQTRLSEELITHRSNITGLVDRLERAKWVERHAVEGDRRCYQVRLTTRGTALMREILPHYYAAAEQVWVGLSEDRVRQLTEDLRLAAANSQRVATEAELEQENSTRRSNHESDTPKDRKGTQGQEGKRVRNRSVQP